MGDRFGRGWQKNDDNLDQFHFKGAKKLGNT